VLSREDYKNLVANYGIIGDEVKKAIKEYKDANLEFTKRCLLKIPYF